MSFTEEDAVDLHCVDRVPYHLRRRSGGHVDPVRDPIKNMSLSEHDLLSIGRYLLDVSFITSLTSNYGRSRWPRGLRRGSAAACLLGLWVRIPPESWMSVSCECCVLSGRSLCDGPTPRPEDSYRLWCV